MSAWREKVTDAVALVVVGGAFEHAAARKPRSSSNAWCSGMVSA